MTETTSLHLAQRAREQHKPIPAIAELLASLDDLFPSDLGHREEVSLLGLFPGKTPSLSSPRYTHNEHRRRKGHLVDRNARIVDN
jgi:hypothetical protein